MTSPRKKVLFIVLDQLRAECVFGGLFGGPVMPRLAELMGQSAVFRRHFSNANPCGPARACLLTGLYAMNHRSVRNGSPLSAHHTNVALEIRKAGYEPLLFGYTDTTRDPRTLPPADPDLESYENVLPGFNEVVEMRFGESLPWRADLKRKGYALPSDPDDIFRPVAADPARAPSITDPAVYTAADSDTAFLADRTIEALSVREDRNWLAHVTFIRPHPPFVAPAPYNTLYDPAEVSPPVSHSSRTDERAVHPFTEALLGVTRVGDTVRGFDGRIDDDDASAIQAIRAVYLGLANEVDHHIGRIVDHLKATGQFDETLIIVTADHGEMLGDHHSWGKVSFYDAAFRVPLLVRDPLLPGSHDTALDIMSEAVDIAPTILDWLGLAPPPAFNGRSLLPQLRGEESKAKRDYVFFELDYGSAGHLNTLQRSLNVADANSNLAVLRENRFKYVHFNGGLPPLLFDLENDPDELRDLAGDPAFAPELQRLSRKMIDHRMTFADSTLGMSAI
ncbi:alkaline phosphatase family protein [Pararhizobium mangrovi]|uniref:Alkaline phosphatase family protein n=1 Tax=Pararhizobium mangrovi TaxID=2590452 RepID=A0A506UB71_9HYPH|nr:alkaline phosphatase family protein [Pararhizobium mangrovi]TPW30284.1 alkaline phosphatase family protein [Pararhizobium mangrovi]